MCLSLQFNPINKFQNNMYLVIIDLGKEYYNLFPVFQN